MKKPLIALSARGTETGTRIYYDNESYFNYVSLGGGIPCLVKADNEEDAEQIAEDMDALLITGGEDVDPFLYDEENTFSIPIDADLDASDIYLYHAFRKAGKPVLGICRGIQVIAVAEGESLIQDIKKEDPSCMEHNQRNLDPPVANDVFVHHVSFVPGTKTAEIFGTVYGVNTFHHQALRSVPEGFTLAGKSTDGLIEAIECPDVLGVQWHPERLYKDPKHLKLMQEFVRMASARKAG